MTDPVLSRDRTVTLNPFDDDTLEARCIRAEASEAAIARRCEALEVALAACDQALLDERVPLVCTGGGRLTRMGRIRLLGDRCRRLERHLLALGEEIE